MAHNKDWVDVVSKLNEMTQDGKQKWGAYDVSESLTQGTDDKITFVYQTKYKDWNLAIYEVRFKDYDHQERPFWNSKLVLDFQNDSGESLFKVDDIRALSDLFESVKYQSANIKGFLDDFFKED